MENHVNQLEPHWKIIHSILCRLVLRDESKVSTIRNAVQATIEGSEQARLFGKELSFVLPRDKVTSFPQLFHLVS